MRLLPLKSIFLVDDDQISNLFNKIFISKLNIDVDVEVAMNGREALEVLSDVENPIQTPCLLLLDVKMPIMDGWEFLKRYDVLVDERLKSQIIITMLTTSEDEADMLRANNNTNVKEFLRKPLSERKITELIRKYFTTAITV